MENLIRYKTFLVIVFVLIIYSCKQSDEFIEPAAKMSIINNNITILDKLEVKNFGSGQKFVFWPGDAGHDYNLKSLGNNYGLAPNAGIDFIYYYPKPGVYTVIMIASSYDAASDKLVQKLDSAKVTVTGSAINNFTSFAIQNAYTGYSPIGVIKNDSILIKVVPVLYPSYPDSIMAIIINKDLPLFAVAENMDYVTVKDENDNVYKGVGADLTPLNLFKIIGANTLVPNIRTFTVIDNLTQNVHSYKVAAMMYPELYSLSFDGSNSILFSKDGLSVDPSIPYKMDNKGKYVFDDNGKKIVDTVSYYHMHADSMYVGVFIVTDPAKTVPSFSVAPDCVVTYNGEVLTSGVSKVDLTVQPVIFNITRAYGGFKITTKVAVNYTVF